MSREAIKLIIKRHIEAIQAGVPSKCHALLMGPSGSGKTYTIEKALNTYEYDIPIIKIDATALSQEGWAGTSIRDILYPLLIKQEARIIPENLGPAELEFKSRIGTAPFSMFNQPKLEHAIIYIDEIDKLGNKQYDQIREHAEGIQQNLLALLDGGVHTIHDPNSNTKRNSIDLNFDNITFIFSGAFSALWDKKEKQTIGFFNQVENKQIDLHDKLLDWGFSKELTYRIPYVIKIDPYTKDQLRNIVNTHFGVKQMEDLYGVPVNKEDLVKFIQNHKAGARAIQIYLGNLDVKYMKKRIK